MIAREVEIEDAEQLSKLIQNVEVSSEYMLWESGVREIGTERQKNIIERMKDSYNSTIL